MFCLPEFGKRKMKQTIRKCLHWIASDARQTIADVKYAFRRRSQRVLLAVQMAAWVVILGEFIIMSICLDYSWFGEIVVIWYFILLITDSKHLLSVMRIKDTDWTQVLFKIFNIRTGTADILTG